MTVPETVPERIGVSEEVSKSTSEVHVTTAADENTPLLSSSGPQSQGNGSSSRTHANSDEEAPLLADRGDDSEQPNEDLEEKKPRTAGWYIWRGLVLIVTVFLATIFIKGWIDGDVDFVKALQSAFRGGVSGAAAMFLQVLLLMPLRTIMNYQYRYGSSFTAATKTLYNDGGYGRYYQGLGAALFQGPLARFGDTAANAGILAILAKNPYIKDSPKWFQTIFVSFCAAGFRIALTPIDTLKTTLQTQGARGTAILRRRIKTDGITSLWWGAIATALATFVGNYPWFATYNTLEGAIPPPSKDDQLILWLLRLAFIGFVASVVSDSVSNSLRVVKTYRQVNDIEVSYTQAARNVVREDGVLGLLGRGLKTRILCNGLQGLLFSILWKLFLDALNRK
ncbi:Mitochondrial carrier domain containing protein [Naviculisporaceae sp. PSN 640]